MKTPALESLFNKITGLNGCNFIKNRLQHRYIFPVSTAKFKKNFFLSNISGGSFWPYMKVFSQQLFLTRVKSRLLYIDFINYAYTS